MGWNYACDRYVGKGWEGNDYGIILHRKRKISNHISSDNLLLGRYFDLVPS
jgi:hypothetical protein